METSSTDQIKSGAKKCQIEGCGEVTVGCRTLLCRRHRNTKYKQNYKKKKRKAQGIEEKHRESVESQLAEEKYLLERQYASMLQQVLNQKRLEVLNSGSVMQLLRNHQQKVREKKEKEMKEKRREAQLRPQPTQQQNDRLSYPVSSGTPDAPVKGRPATTTGPVSETEGIQKVELSFTSSQGPSAVPANKINTLANIVCSVTPKTNNGVSPSISNTAMSISKNSGTVVHSKTAHGTSISRVPSLMPHTSSDSGITIAMSRGSYGTALTSGNFSMPAGNLAIVQLPGNSGITVSTGNTGVLQSSVNSGLAMPTATALLSCAAAPAGNAAIVPRDTCKVIPLGNLGFIETPKKLGVSQTLGNSDIVVWTRKDEIPQTSRNSGMALPTSNARILPASTSSGITVPAWNPGITTTTRNTEIKQAISNCWMTQALEHSAKAPTASTSVAGSLSISRNPNISQTQTYSAATVSAQSSMSSTVGSFSPGRSATDRLCSQASLAQGVQGTSPNAVHVRHGASNQRGASTNRRILPHNAATTSHGLLNSQACAEGVRQLRLAANKAAAAALASSVSRPLLASAQGSQTGRQRVRTVTTPAGYLRPTQRILPNQSSTQTTTRARQENGNVRVPCGTQIRAPGVMPRYIQTPVSMANIPVQHTGRLLPGNLVAQQQNFSGCVKGGQQLGGVNFPATGITRVAPQTGNHLLAGVSPGPTMAQQGVVSEGVWVSHMQAGRPSMQTGIIPPQDELLFQTLQVTKDTGLPMNTGQPQNPASATLDQLMAEGPWALSIGL